MVVAQTHQVPVPETLPEHLVPSFEMGVEMACNMRLPNTPMVALDFVRPGAVVADIAERVDTQLSVRRRVPPFTPAEKLAAIHGAMSAYVTMLFTERVTDA